MRPESIDGGHQSSCLHVQQKVMGRFFGPAEALTHSANSRDGAAGIERDGIGDKVVRRPGFQVQASQQGVRKVLEILRHDRGGLGLYSCGEHMRIVWIRQCRRQWSEMREINNLRLPKCLTHSRNLGSCHFLCLSLKPTLADEYLRDGSARFLKNRRRPPNSEEVRFRQCQQQVSAQHAGERAGIDEGCVAIGEQGSEQFGVGRRQIV